jgi:hypothetical protein
MQHLVHCPPRTRNKQRRQVLKATLHHASPDLFTFITPKWHSQILKKGNVQRFTFVTAILPIHSFYHNFQLLMNNKQSAKMHLEHSGILAVQKPLIQKLFMLPLHTKNL